MDTMAIQSTRISGRSAPLILVLAKTDRLPLWLFIYRLQKTKASLNSVCAFLPDKLIKTVLNYSSTAQIGIEEDKNKDDNVHDE